MKTFLQRMQTAIIVAVLLSATLARAVEVKWQEPWRVKDEVGILSPLWHSVLLARVSLFQQERQRHFAVWIKASAPPEAVDELLSAKYEAWGLAGDPNTNRAGLLLLVDVKARTAYVAVGPDLTERVGDSVSRDIVTARMEPLMRKDEFGDAINVGLAALMHAAEGNGVWDIEAEEAPPFQWRRFVWPAAVALIFAAMLAGFIAYVRRSTKQLPPQALR